MFINNHIQSLASVYGAQAVGGTKGRKPVTKSAESSSVQLSTQAQDFSAILQKIRSKKDDVRMDRVEELESQISAGTYKIDEKAVAASMLNMRY
ncbi:MAG: flagellar biosynthesis anti-sigma factor FlgM [Schwartzia sp.]|nr:flagellar biosynthesis anti-sigma factor FlgM [Schwartzia sp. (in: firmicutes)]